MFCYVAFPNERYVNEDLVFIRRSVTVFSFRFLHCTVVVFLPHYKSYSHCIGIADSRCEGASKYPSLRVQTRPKLSGFFRAKKFSACLSSEGK